MGMGGEVMNVMENDEGIRGLGFDEGVDDRWGDGRDVGVGVRGDLGLMVEGREGDR